MRCGSVERKTLETEIFAELNLDGSGICQVNTGIGFFDHMLTLFASHGMFDLKVKCNGDLNVDAHHTVEDVGICLGKAFEEAMGDKKGIKRFADKTIPMDEALVLVATYISGRPYLGFSLDVPAKRVGTFDTELVSEFFYSFVRNAKLTLHINKLAGKNTHHIIEGCFKAFGRVMDEATLIDPRRADVLPSTKGVL